MISFVTKSYLLLAPTSTPDMLLQLITVQLATRMGGFKTMLQRHLVDMNVTINFNLQESIWHQETPQAFIYADFYSLEQASKPFISWDIDDFASGNFR